MEYRYTSTEERVYVDRALTVNTGDVVDWPDGPPADGHWEPTDETRAELDRLEAERAAAEEAAAKTEQKAPPGMAGNPGLEVLRTAPPNAGMEALKSAADGAKADGEGTEPTEPGPATTAAETTKE